MRSKNKKNKVMNTKSIGDSIGDSNGIFWSDMDSKYLWGNKNITKIHRSNQKKNDFLLFVKINSNEHNEEDTKIAKRSKPLSKKSSISLRILFTLIKF